MIVRRMNEPVFALEVTKEEAEEITKVLGSFYPADMVEVGVNLEIANELYTELAQALEEYTK